MSTQADLQTVLVKYLDQYRRTHRLSARERQVCQHIVCCRTPAMGGLQLACSECAFTRAQYHACRDRHCPKCQRAASRQWCERQREHLLPVTYHHIVFTLPAGLNGWVSLYPERIYHQLFQSAWHSLKRMGADPKRLNGQMGVTAVLHTWGENLSRHVHLHCLVPGGALGADGQWHRAKSDYLFPVRALSRLFRGHMVSALRQMSRRGELHASSAAEVTDVLNELMGKEWVVYSKPCPVKARTVVDYLGRYSHRIAISDQRIESVSDGEVRFSVKDYRNNGVRRLSVLSGEEFIRRYLLHVLPKGLMRIRHYGFLANRCRKRKLQALRKAIECPACEQQQTDKEPKQDYVCPRCKKGVMSGIRPLPVTRLREA